MGKKEKRKVDSLHTVTGKFNDALFGKMQQWLQQNGMSANQLLSKAVEQYISQPQTLEPVEMSPATEKQVSKSLQRMKKQHARALDELK